MGFNMRMTLATQTKGLGRFAVLISVSILTLFGCESRFDAASPSVLIIAIDEWPNTGQECTESNDLGMPEPFCQEAVRFTHCYTPSTQSVPTLSSVFTGLYPFEHGVRNNSQFLLNRFITLPELAVRNGYRTAFFSSGAPLLRRSGLNQGFEIFDDSLGSKPNYVRNLNSLSESFLNWRSGFSGPFFATLYVQDLHFQSSSMTDVGERSLGNWQSTIENLEKIYRDLKKTGEWDNTIVVVFGTHGAEAGRVVAHPELNLNRERTQVPLWIKPNYFKRDIRSFRANDTPVSLVDITPTLLEKMRIKDSETHEMAKSLAAMVAGPVSNSENERIIVSESAWGAWRGISEIRVGIRKGNYYLILDEQPKIYNTLIDSNETSPIPLKDASIANIKKEIFGFSERIGFALWREPAEKTVEDLVQSTNSDNLWLSHEGATESWKSCLKLLQISNFVNQDCGDELLRYFFTSRESDQTAEVKAYYLDILLDQLQLLVQRRNWTKHNRNNGWILNSFGPEIFQKTYIEQLLLLPEFAQSKQQIESRLKGLLKDI